MLNLGHLIGRGGVLILLQILLDFGERNRLRGGNRTPRIANSLLDWVRDYSVSKNVRTMCKNSVRDALKMKRIGIDGSTEQDRSYMKLISDMREPVGLKTLSSMLNIEQETIENVIEPFLLQRGLIAKTKRGRILTNKER